MTIRNILTGMCCLLIAGIAQAFTYQGELSQSGTAFNGVADIRFTLYDAATEGAVKGVVDLRSNVVISNGRFVVELDQWDKQLDGTSLWLEIAAAIPAGGSLTTLEPRQKIDPAPYAQFAYKGASDAGDITAVIAGTGLSGGATSGDATLNVNTSQIQQRVFGACPAGESIQIIAENGKVGCEVDTDTTYNAGTALSLNEGTFNVSVGAGNGLDADLLDGQHASAIIAAANSEMRTPISGIPFTITESGSYYLTQNLKMLSSTSDGIAVLADNVTIDMMGFTLEGATNSKNGINLDTQNNVVIYNGTIINFPWAAIYQNSATPGNHAFVENVRVVENGYTTQYPSAYPAIALTGSDNVVSAVYAFNNTADGIRVGPTSVVKDSTSTNNGRDGITVGISSSALNNIVANNQGWGLIGGWGSAIIGNTVYSNNQGQATDSGGLRVFRGSQVENNTVYNNYHSGLWVFGSTNVLRNNHVTSSQPVSGDYYCFYFSQNLNVAIGNTATGCSIEFGGNVPAAARFVDNFQW